MQLTVKFEISTTIGAAITFKFWFGAAVSVSIAVEYIPDGTVVPLPVDVCAMDCCTVKLPKFEGGSCNCWCVDDCWWWCCCCDWMSCCCCCCCVWDCEDCDACAHPLGVDETISEHAESSLCHLELLWRAVFIWAQRSFLHDFDLKLSEKQCKLKQLLCRNSDNLLIVWIQSLNCAFPSGVIWNAARAANIMLAKSS